MTCSRPSVICLLLQTMAHNNETAGWVGNIVKGSSPTITTPFMKFTEIERITVISAAIHGLVCFK